MANFPRLVILPIVPLAQALAVVLLGVLLARLFWVMVEPDLPAVLTAPLPTSPSHAALLFGATPVSAVDTTTSVSNMQLLGVFAPTDGAGFAILQLDSKNQKGVIPGGEISPGSRLLEIHPDHVFVEQAGLRQRINLKGMKIAYSVPAPGTAPLPVTPVAQLAPPPAAGAALEVQSSVEQKRLRMTQRRPGRV